MSKTLETLRNEALTYEIGPNRHERRCLGPLHERLTQFLPDFIDENEEFVNTRRLAMALDMTYAGVHRWMRPGEKNRISPQAAQRLVNLSKLTDPRHEGFRPARIEDFWEFVVP